MSIVWGGPFADWENACITDEVTAKSAKSWKWRFWECANAAGSCCASASRKTFVWWWFLWLGMLLVASETSKMWKPELKCGNSGSLVKKNWGLCHRGQVTLHECCHSLLGVKHYPHTFLHQSLLLDSPKLRRESSLFGSWLVFTWVSGQLSPLALTKKNSPRYLLG